MPWGLSLYNAVGQQPTHTTFVFFYFFSKTSLVGVMMSDVDSGLNLILQKVSIVGNRNNGCDIFWPSIYRLFTMPKKYKFNEKNLLSDSECYESEQDKCFRQD